MRLAAALWELLGPRITGPRTSLKMLGGCDMAVGGSQSLSRSFFSTTPQRMPNINPASGDVEAMSTLSGEPLANATPYNSDSVMLS